MPNIKQTVTLVKETDLDGNIYFCTEWNGKPVPSSVFKDESSAKNFYDGFIKRIQNKGSVKKEILITKDIIC